VAFVEDGSVALGILRRNVGLMRVEAQVDVIRRDATKLGPVRGAGFGLAFLDPPYGRGLGEAALASAQAGGWLQPGAIVVWEEGVAPEIPAGFDPLDQRRYGDTVVTILRMA